VLAFVLIVIVAISVSSYVAFAPKQSIQSGGNSIGAGVIASDFSLPATSGGTFRLSDYRGKSNVLLFFNEGLSCQPCLTQMQGLDTLNANFKNLNIVTISITADPPQALSQWVQSGGPRYGMVLSDQGLQVSRMYDMLGPNVSMMPGSAPGHSFVLVNKDGVIVWRHDYGPYNMSVPNDEIMAAVKQALGT
jgi:peroxiredoxin Q/BCP